MLYLLVPTHTYRYWFPLNMRTLRIGPACLDYCGSEPATLLESIHRIGLVVKKANDIVVAVDLYVGEQVTPLWDIKSIPRRRSLVQIPSFMSPCVSGTQLPVKYSVAPPFGCGLRVVDNDCITIHFNPSERSQTHTTVAWPGTYTRSCCPCPV